MVLWKVEYSDFCIFAKFKTLNILYFLYIRNILRQNCFAKFWQKYNKISCETGKTILDLKTNVFGLQTYIFDLKMNVFDL